MGRTAQNILIASLAITCLSSCISSKQESITKEVLARADKATWTTSVIPVDHAAGFQLFSLRNPINSANGILYIYLEGDGHVWEAGMPSDDPTPINPTGLQLALAQQNGAVAYLASPCQYIGATSNPKCVSGLWTNQRYSPATVKSLQGGVDFLKKSSGASRIILVGYSGGGTLALLMAAQRNDIEKVVTVAGNLDTSAWTSYHRLPPLVGSLNPIDFVTQNQNLPQHHLVGGKDEVVPASIALQYSERYPEKNRPKVQVIVENNHVCCWVSQWPILIQNILAP